MTLAYVPVRWARSLISRRPKRPRAQRTVPLVDRIVGSLIAPPAPDHMARRGSSELFWVIVAQIVSRATQVALPPMPSPRPFTTELATLRAAWNRFKASTDPSPKSPSMGPGSKPRA